MKRLITLLTVLALLLSALTACGSSQPRLTLPTSPTVTTAPPVSLPGSVELGRDLIYTFTDTEEGAILARLSELRGMIELGEDYAAFEALYLQVSESDLLRVLSEQQIAYLYYSAELDRTEYEERYLALDSLYTRIVEELSELYPLIYGSPFRDSFYEGWSEEEIAEALRMAEIYTPAYTALSEEISRITADQLALDQTSPTYASDTASLYITFVKKQNALAALAGYANYVDYAYADIYGRDYGPADLAAFRDAIANEVAPLIPSVYSALTDALSGLDKVQMAMVTGLLLGDYDGMGKGMLNRYIERVSAHTPHFGEVYAALWENGSYLIAKDADVSREGAFTTYIPALASPFLYLGPGYATVMTLIHEFGHFYAFDTLGIVGMEQSLDLSETQSQGNEWIFLASLNDGETDESLLEIVRAIVLYQLFNATLTLVLANVIDEFECTVYRDMASGSALSAAALDRSFRAICERYVDYELLSSLMGVTPEEYWRLVVFEQASYYISYATSAIGALELFVLAESQGTDAALDAYFSLVGYDPESGIGYASILEGAGLHHPVNGDAVGDIAAFIGSYVRN